MAALNADLVRDILLETEQIPPTNSYATITSEGVSQENISYHIKILAQDGLIEARDFSTLGGFRWKVRSLTADGHRFLDDIRDNSRWSKIKGALVQQGKAVSLALVKAIASHMVKQETGLDISL